MRTRLPAALRAALLTLIASFVLTLAVPVAAQAATCTAGIHTAGVTSSVLITDVAPGAGQQGTYQASSVCAASDNTSAYLPINRWSDAVGQFHNRLGASTFDDMVPKFQRQVTAGTFTVGTFLWQSAAGVIGKSMSFCALDTAGEAVDKGFAAIGNAVMGRGDDGSSNAGGAVVVTLLIAASLGATVYRSRKGSGGAGGTWKKLISVLAVVGILLVMTNGAMNSTTTAPSTGAAQYVPGKLSPGWVISRLNNATASLMNMPAQALAMTVGSSASAPYASCSAYVNQLNAEAYGGTKTIDMVISTMWMDTGVSSWKNAQYGTPRDDGSIPLADNAYCQQLDRQAGVPASASAALFNKVLSVDGGTQSAVSTSLAFSQKGVNQENRAIIGWAACQINPDGTTSPHTAVNYGRTEWNASIVSDETGSKGKGISGDNCTDWWTDGGGDNGNSGMEFENSDQIVDATTDDGATRQFLSNLDGFHTGSGQVASFGYVLSGLAILSSFGLIGAAIFIGKITQIVLILMLGFFLVLAMWSSASGDNKLTKYAKTALGVTIFVNAGSLVVGVVALVSSTVVNAGLSVMGGNGTLMGNLWVGAGPLIAVYIVGMLFKQAGAPSPFKLGSALAFGAAAGTVGGVAAGAINNMGSRGANMARMAGSRAVSGRGGRGSRSMGSGSGRAGGSTGLGGALAAGAAGGAIAGHGSKGRGASGRIGSAADSLRATGAMSSIDQARSELARGQMTRQERNADRLAALAMRKDARKHSRQMRRTENDATVAGLGKLGGVSSHGSNGKLDGSMRDRAQYRAALAAGRGKERLEAIKNRIQENPRRAAWTGVKKTAKYGAIGAAVVGAPILAAPVLAVGAAIKLPGMVRSARERIESPDGFVGRRRVHENNFMADRYSNDMKAADEKGRTVNDSTRADAAAEVDRMKDAGAVLDDDQTAAAEQKFVDQAVIEQQRSARDKARTRYM